MTTELTKIDVARFQLQTAIRLFFDDSEPVSIQPVQGTRKRRITVLLMLPAPSFSFPYNCPGIRSGNKHSSLPPANLATRLDGALSNTEDACGLRQKDDGTRGSIDG